jgi:hypothetical protein
MGDEVNDSAQVRRRAFAWRECHSGGGQWQRACRIALVERRDKGICARRIDESDDDGEFWVVRWRRRRYAQVLSD